VSPCLLSATTERRPRPQDLRDRGRLFGSRRSSSPDEKRKTWGALHAHAELCELAANCVVPSALTCTGGHYRKRRTTLLVDMCSIPVSRVSPTRHNCWRSTSTQRRSAPPGRATVPMAPLAVANRLSHDVAGQSADLTPCCLGTFLVSSGRTLA